MPETTERKPLTRQELEAILKRANEEAAIFILPKIEEGAGILNEAFTPAWLMKLQNYIGSLPEGDLKANIANLYQHIGQMGTLLDGQKAIATKNLPPPTA